MKTGWERINRESDRLLKEVTSNLTEAEFELLAKTLEIEGEYQHYSNVPVKMICERLHRSVEKLFP